VAKVGHFTRVRIAPPHLLDANVMMRTGRRDRLLQLIEDADFSFDAQHLEVVV
jgi:hypothetical protein